jgi:hypothetical protein
MKFIKEKNEERRDYIFQKDEKTKIGAAFIFSVLLILIMVVGSTYFTLS